MNFSSLLLRQPGQSLAGLYYSLCQQFTKMFLLTLSTEHFIAPHAKAALKRQDAEKGYTCSSPADLYHLCYPILPKRSPAGYGF